MIPMKLVVGIGNPGRQYVGTRHNVGYEVVERVASRHALTLERDKRLNARVARGRIADEDVTLLEPLSYVNRTGPVVARVVRERDVEHDDVLIVLDDFNLPLGRLRVRAQGSAGGHNGMRSLLAHVGELPRLRIGIGTPPPGEAERFVLTRFRPSERDRIEDAYEASADCVEDWIASGTAAAMNRHNPGRGSRNEDD